VVLNGDFTEGNKLGS